MPLPSFRGHCGTGGLPEQLLKWKLRQPEGIKGPTAISAGAQALTPAFSSDFN